MHLEYMLIILVATTCLDFVWSYNKKESILVKDGDLIRPPTDFLTKHYLKDQHLVWNLTAETGVWGLIFRNFTVESSTDCRYDYVEVQELIENSADVDIPASRYCGTVRPNPYISEHSRVQVRFISDNIWETDGFTIQAVHSRTREIMREKLAGFVNEPQEYLALSSEDSKDKNKDNNTMKPLFYVLIGSSAAALLIFCSLLIFFAVKTFINQRSSGQQLQQQPVVFFSSASGQRGVPSTVLLTSAIGRNTKRWRRPSRDKSVPSTSCSLASGSGICNTTQKDSQTGTTSQHNNLYVAHV